MFPPLILWVLKLQPLQIPELEYIEYLGAAFNSTHPSNSLNHEASNVYIEFDHPEYVSMAIDLSGQLLLGEPKNIEPVNAGDPSTGESDTKAKGVVDPKADLERDPRTVYVSKIPLWVTREDVNKFFSSVCKVRDMELLLDPHRREKAVGYLEFDHPKYVSMAIDLSGQLLRGEPINIEPVNAGDPSTGERELMH